jgi:hypothetical protein
MNRRRGFLWVPALAALLLAPAAALAEGESLSRLESMESRLMALEDKLAASEATIAAQSQLLEQANVNGAVSAPAGSLAAFFDDLVVGGWVEASYIYNFNNPDVNIGTQNSYQFNRNHNNFALNGVKLELGKPASEPGSAGFQFDLLFGDNAQTINNSLESFYTNASDSLVGDNGLFIQQAYVSYNMRGVVFKLGKFVTPMGYEVLDAPYNPHVTHSEVFFAGIPLFHTGLLAEGNMGENVQWLLGVTNGFNNATDYNDNKAVLASLGWMSETASVKANGFWGSEALRLNAATQGTPPGTGDVGGPTSSQMCVIGGAAFVPAPASGGGCAGENDSFTQIYEVVATLTPSEQLEFWADGVWGSSNLDFGTQVVSVGADVANGPAPANQGDPWWAGFAVGSVLGLNEQTDLGLRYGYLYDHRSTRIAGIVPVNLTGRVEYRHDWENIRGSTALTAPQGSDRVFLKGKNKASASQDVGMVEFYYTFN